MVEHEKGYRCKLLSSLAKVFPSEEPVYRPECAQLTGLWGDTVSFQVAYIGESPRRELLAVSVEAAPELAGRVRVRSVVPVPVGRATNGTVDDGYLRTESGMYPDLLRDIPGGRVVCDSVQWRSLWVDVELDDSVAAGSYDVSVGLSKDGETVCSQAATVQVIGMQLPPQRMKHTEWLHADCLADRYGVPAFSEGHWKLLESCLRNMAHRGINMVLTPLFTPPLDTGVGLERTTVQLVDVAVQDGEYSFGFGKLERWVRLARECGLEYFEMSHLFSQWGAVHPPKVVGTVDGEPGVRIFGWDTPAVGEYTRFLQALLPQLACHLREWGVADRTYFHVSDEPGQHMESYVAARESLGGLLEGFRCIDAVSSYGAYKEGAIDIPVPGNDEVEEFLQRGVPERWTYYCTGQFLHVSNRFMSMPSARNRILGVQCYKYRMDGFLHWGYNFYNSQLSIDRLNPYEVTDAGGAFPAGDAFLVYPGADGRPEESIRLMVMAQAMADVRALELLERLAGRDFVMELVEGELAEPLTFSVYPKSDLYLLQLRNRVNREIGKRAGCAEG